MTHTAHTMESSVECHLEAFQWRAKYRPFLDQKCFSRFSVARIFSVVVFAVLMLLPSFIVVVDIVVVVVWLSIISNGSDSREKEVCMPTDLLFQSNRTYGSREANTIALLQSTNIHVTVLLTHKLPSIKKKATTTHTKRI